MRTTMWLASLATMSMLAACTSTSSPGSGTPYSQQSSSTAALFPAPFEATVDNTAMGGDCLRMNCWQPIQFGPNLVELESASLEERTTPDGKVIRAGWPNNRDIVTVLCIGKGESYQNLLNQPDDNWYGIRIPTDKVEPKAMNNSRLRKAPDGNGYMGFVETMWLTGGEHKRAPACPVV